MLGRRANTTSRVSMLLRKFIAGDRMDDTLVVELRKCECLRIEDALIEEVPKDLKSKLAGVLLHVPLTLPPRSARGNQPASSSPSSTARSGALRQGRFIGAGRDDDCKLPRFALKCQGPGDGRIVNSDTFCFRKRGSTWLWVSPKWLARGVLLLGAVLWDSLHITVEYHDSCATIAAKR